MQRNESITLDLNIDTKAPLSVIITGGLGNIEKCYSQIGNILSASFDPITDTLEPLKTSIENLMGSIDKANEYLKSLLEQLSSGLSNEETLSIFSSIATIFTSIAGFFATGLAGAPVIATGWIGILIAAVITAIVLIITYWDELSLFFTELGGKITALATQVWTAVQEKLTAFGEFMRNIFAKDFTEQLGILGISLNVFFDRVEGVWNAIKKVFGGIVDFVKNAFAGNWSAAWDSIVQIFTGIWEGIVGYFKPPLNAIIGFINGLISAIVNAVNFVIRAVNKLSIDIPNWDIFGSLAGKTFGLNIPLVSGCEIPYLAKGAVLPANRPFMAIVGDQRHGTNVEAPLATIQEAVAVVMEDQTAAIVAGFNASIGIQRELLSAVLGIRIGDEVIGRAADRYFAKRAAMGGY